MLPGERIPTIVRKILDEASCVVVVWSARSSESNWVPDEATYGRDHNMLIPVSLDGTPPPLGFQQLLTQDLAGWDGGADDVRIQKVVAAVRTHLRGAEPSSSRPAQGDATRTMQPPVNTRRSDDGIGRPATRGSS